MKKRFDIVSNFSLKGLDEESDKLVIEGYANTTSKDRVGDVIMQEAWTKGGMDNYLKNPIVLAYHDHSSPIGEVVDYGISDKGLYVVAEISKAAGNVYQLIKDGILKAFSVGIGIKDAVYDKQEDIFYVKDVELLELSVVSVPANADSLFSLAKAFEDNAEYEAFKKNFVIEEDKSVEPIAEIEATLEEKEVDIESAVAGAVASAKEEFIDVIKTELSNSSNTEKEENNMTVTVESGVEKLIQDLEARFADKEKSFSDALDGLRQEVKDKADEIEALRKNKHQFADRGSSSIVTLSPQDMDNAVLLAKATNKSIDGTDFFKNLVRNKALEHIDDTNGWDEIFSTNIYNEMQTKLVVESLFNNINMNSATMFIPTNPDPTTLATWIASTAYSNVTQGLQTASTGTAVAHQLGDRTLTAYKLAAKDYLGDEEDEDAILPILPIIRSALVRRMSNKADQSILTSTGTVDTVSIFRGLIGLAAGATTPATITDAVSAASGAVTVADLHNLRVKLGIYGTNPSEVVYIVSTEAYYDLINNVGDTNVTGLTTIDKYGDKATILNGEIGSLWGSKVLVSNNFGAKANDAYYAVAVNPGMFIRGQLRGMRVETDRDVEKQARVIVATRRMGFLGMIGHGANGAYGVAAGQYAV